jgi:hypothetical protein
MRILVLASVLIVVSAAALAGHASVDKIVISGANLPAPIEFNEPAVGRFQVWEGRGTFKNSVEQMEGFIIDWPKGAAASRPEGLLRYKVAFASRDGDYVVYYEFDARVGHGYVYLPGKNDPEYAKQIMVRGSGLEGNWHFASKDWDETIRPVIAKALAAH